MKTHKILLLPVLLVTCLSGPEVLAQTISFEAMTHGYIGGFLGTQLEASGNTKIPSIASKPPLTSEPAYDIGYTLGLNAGYKFHNSFRVEGELAYQNLPMNKINDAIGLGTVTQVKNSHTELFSLFMNSYCDFRVSQHWTPYLGVGIGYIEVENTIKPTPPIPVSQNLFFTKKVLNYNTFGYQGIMGLGYQLTQNIILSLNYKYFSTFEMKATGHTNLGADGYQTKQRVTDQTILFGIKYFFT